MTLFASSKWTREATARLRECIAGKLSAGESSRKLSTEFGVAFTRNALISKAARLGLTFEGSPKNGHSTKPRPPRPKPAPRPPQDPGRNMRADVPDMAEPRPLGDVSTGCRWLHSDDPRERNFCGADRHKGSSYCAHHFARCFREPAPLKTKRFQRQVTRLANFYT